MESREIIRLLVLSEISDDFEEPKHIHERVSDRGRAAGLAIETTDVENAIVDLLRLGLAKAYRLSPSAPETEVFGVLRLEALRECYFLITERGLNTLADWRKEWWPFDDEGDFLPDWSPIAD